MQGIGWLLGLGGASVSKGVPKKAESGVKSSAASSAITGAAGKNMSKRLCVEKKVSERSQFSILQNREVNNDFSALLLSKQTSWPNLWLISSFSSLIIAVPDPTQAPRTTRRRRRDPPGVREYMNIHNMNTYKHWVCYVRVCVCVCVCAWKVENRRAYLVIIWNRWINHDANVRLSQW